MIQDASSPLIRRQKQKKTTWDTDIWIFLAAWHIKVNKTEKQQENNRVKVLVNRAGFNSQAIFGGKSRWTKCHLFPECFSSNLRGNPTVGIGGSWLRGAAAFEPLPPPEQLRPSPHWQPHLDAIRENWHACSQQIPSRQRIDSSAPYTGHFPTLCLCRVPLTCWVRGLYGELLSRSARMLVRESISASKLDRLSSSVLPPGFTLKKKEEFQLHKPLVLVCGFLLSSQSWDRVQQ